LYICGTRAKCPKSKSPPKKCSFWRQCFEAF
jgi:hypothetical protein